MTSVRDVFGPLLRPTDPPPRLTRGGMLFDAVLALLLGAVGARLAYSAAHNYDATGPGPVGIGIGIVPMPPMPPPPEPGQWVSLAVLSFVVIVPLIVRRRYPLTVLWLVMGLFPLLAIGAPNLTYACVVAAYSACVYSPYRILAVLSLPAALLVSQARESGLPRIPNEVAPFLILGLIVVAANGLRVWRQRADEGRARVAALEREQAEALRRAAEQERARIARELHDVVTHNVSVMVIQAGAARKIMDADPGQAREALLAVEAGGRAAMAELRHVMGLLAPSPAEMAGSSGGAASFRGSAASGGPVGAAASDGLAGFASAGVGPGEAGPDGVELAPQPDLDRLPALVGRVRDTGLPVELTVSGRPCPVPAGVGLAAYRVVQEALTNTVKHAAGATAAVIVEYGPDRLRVEVTDTGGRPGAAAGSGAGRGLVGLRERLAVYGGTLHAGRRTSGGYQVTALIPLESQ